ncbi:MAG: hypothetical protein PIR02_16910 [Microbacterium enclense]
MSAGFLVGVLFLVLGVIAYTGIWKGWIRVRRGFGSTIGFAWLWLGAAFTTAAVAVLVQAYSRAAFFALLGVAAVLLIIAVVGAFWLPRFLLPAWYRTLRGDDLTTKGGRA